MKLEMVWQGQGLYHANCPQPTNGWVVSTNNPTTLSFFVDLNALTEAAEDDIIPYHLRITTVDSPPQGLFVVARN